MFRLEIFVDDKKLSYVLWAISGHVLEVKPPQPVVNAQARNGKVVARTSGNKVEMLLQYLGDHKISEFGPEVVREFCTSLGMSEKSYSNILKTALDDKLLKRRPRRGGKAGQGKPYVYSVVKGGA
jgi:hypothetical protein